MVRERSSDPAVAPTDVAPWGSPDAEIGRLLAFTAKVMRSWFEDQLAAAGGSLTTWIVLSAAINSPTSPSQRNLAEGMGIGGPTLVRHLDRLEAEGLVTRRRDDDDRRVTRIDITPAGRRRHQELAAVSARANAELTDLISERDEQIVRSVLQRFNDHLTSTETANRERGTA